MPERSSVCKSVATILLICCCCLVLQASAPKGWFLAGSKPADYETGIDSKTVYNDRPSAYLKSVSTSVEGFGTLMQSISAEKYAGKRIRLSAFVKTKNVGDWAGLWLRVDKGSAPVAFDNMQNRPIKGNTDWHKYEVVLDVPVDATGVSFGTLLTGAGSVWLNGTKLETVDADVKPTTLPVQKLSDTPVNLDFAE